MKKNNSGLTAAQKAFGRGVFRDPRRFASRILGADLWAGEVEILKSLQNHRRTAIKACHGVGKTFTLAVAALWWLARYEKGIVLTTSPTQRQVKTQLWAEIHQAVRRAKVPYPELNMTDAKFRGDDNFATGFSTNQTENFQGYHGRHVLIVADEARGIESGIWVRLPAPWPEAMCTSSWPVTRRFPPARSSTPSTASAACGTASPSMPSIHQI